MPSLCPDVLRHLLEHCLLPEAAKYRILTFCYWRSPAPLDLLLARVELGPERDLLLQGC